ncbi:MAG: DnaB-like helicase C-terminal domain-containing protein [Chthoniobacterales bacterium]
MFANVGHIPLGSMVKDPVRLANKELKNLGGTVPKLSSLPIFLEDRFSVDVSSNISRIRESHARHGLKLVVVDYLQVIESSNIGRNTIREPQISEATRRLLILAKQLDIAIVSMSHVNDDGNLRDCRAISHHADV